MSVEMPATLWDTLSSTDRPVAVYGMGNGADKLMGRLEALGVPVCAVCASDGFVRGQSFRSHRVISLAELHERFGHCYLLVAFGSRLPEVIAQVRALAARFELRIPDMPVTDTAFFDRAFLEEHREALASAQSLFADEHSRALFASLVTYKLTADPDALFAHTTSTEEGYRLLGDGIRSMLDLGAYRGDTATEAARLLPQLTDVYAVEADARSFRKLTALAQACNHPSIEPILAAVGAEDGETTFYGAGNRNSSLAATSHSYRAQTVRTVTVDTLMRDRRVDYIKYDVEGAELDALRGSLQTVLRDRPALRIAAYHRSEDLFRLPQFIAEHAPFYTMYLRRTPCFPAWETDLICIPKER